MKVLEEFKSWLQFGVKPRLEIVFLHIHKTGGKSISKVLQEVYGQDYARVNRAHLIRNDIGLLKPGILNFSRNTKVLAGHLCYAEVNHLIKDQTKIITWLRHPVDRVVSNFYWEKKRYADGLTEEVPIERLEDYVMIPANQNHMSFFLAGLKLDDLFFVGFLNSFEEDLDMLSNMLGWTEYKSYHINRNPSRPSDKPILTREQRKLIESLNDADMMLYKKAKSMRGLTHS